MGPPRPSQPSQPQLFRAPLTSDEREPESKPDPFSRESVRAVIAAAAEARAAEELKAAEDAKAAEAAAAKAQAKAAAREERKKLKATKKVESPEEKQANKDKRLAKLVSPIVVRSMSKYAKSLEHEVFKKHAKEVRLPILILFRSLSNYYCS